MTIAAFDCDGTLIRGDATRRFLLELRGPFGLGSDLLRLARWLIAWRLGRCSMAAFKQALLDRCLQAMSATQRREVLERLPALLIAQLRPEARARLQWHQRQGHRCLIVSASPTLLLAALARHREVELIATGCNDPLKARPGTPFAVRILQAGYLATPMTEGKAPALLCASPASVARDLLRRPNRRGIECLPWWWNPLMRLMRLLPAAIASKL
ncbi:MAG: HAD-IB family phosphatase [Synechococcaceae cyanobacterium]|nr:HAD-IB family phosphatase [Synechococcaceae cyanobacterium]